MMNDQTAANAAASYSYPRSSTRARERSSGSSRAAPTLLLALLCLGVAPAGAQPSNLEQLRGRALELVNLSRQENELPPLTLGGEANRAAQQHAADMLQRDYYAHTSPDGDTVQDRYVEAGGSRWRLTAENIARCSACDPPATLERIERLHHGWMGSPDHRHNILRRGLTEFGFGIAIDRKQGLYAVQTLAGPGTPRGLQAAETPTVLAPAAQASAAVERINRARRQAGLATVESSGALNQAVQSIIPDDNLEDFTLPSGQSLFQAIRGERRGEWQPLSGLAASCGGCGTQPTETDVRYFVQQWLQNHSHEQTLLAPDLTHLGFAIAANGRGRKTALALLGRKR